MTMAFLLPITRYEFSFHIIQVLYGAGQSKECVWHNLFAVACSVRTLYLTLRDPNRCLHTPVPMPAVIMEAT